VDAIRSIYEEIDCVLSPRSIAIVGASADYSKFPGRTVKYVLKHRYPGKLYAVNPARKEVSGIPCFPSVSDLPEPVDMAFIQIAAERVPEVIEQCISRGVKSVVIQASGFGESRGDGKGIQERLKARIKESGIRVVGPNCAGIVNTTENIVVSPIPCYEIDEIPKGRIGLITQSGGMGGACFSRAASRGIGFSCIISTGNEMDLGVNDFARYLLQDANTDAIAIYMEALRDIRGFRSIAEEALELEKPILVYKVGRTEIGAQAAASHTGSITGSDRIYDAFFKQYGIVRVDMLDDLVEASALFCKAKPPRGRKVGVITSTGGGATVIVESLAQADLQLPLPSDDVVERATRILPSFAAKSNPMDVTMSGVGEGFRKVLDVLLSDDAFDMVVAVLGTQSEYAPELGVYPVLEAHKDARKLLGVYCTPNALGALRLFERNGIPSFQTAEACGRSLGYLVKYGDALRAYGTRKEGSPATSSGTAHTLEAKEILRNSGRVLNERDSKRVLSAYGIATTRELLVTGREDARQAARDIGYPVAMKVMSADIPHKTDAGVIELGIESEEALVLAYDEILRKAAVFNPTAKIDGVLVQEMADKGLELIVGMKWDDGFGPVFMCGLGGIYAELFNDAALRVSPLSPGHAAQMVGELKGAKLLQGYRGAEPVDVDAVVEVLMSLARLASDLGGDIRELDINPLIVYPRGKGVMAVDALICR
jgi:acetyltransferase